MGLFTRLKHNEDDMTGMAKSQLRGRLNATWGKEKEKAGPKIQISSLSSVLEHRYML